MTFVFFCKELATMSSSDHWTDSKSSRQLTEHIQVIWVLWVTWVSQENVDQDSAEISKCESGSPLYGSDGKLSSCKIQLTCRGLNRRTRPRHLHPSPSTCPGPGSAVSSYFGSSVQLVKACPCLEETTCSGNYCVFPWELCSFVS